MAGVVVAKPGPPDVSAKIKSYTLTTPAAIKTVSYTHLRAHETDS